MALANWLATLDLQQLSLLTIIHQAALLAPEALGDAWHRVAHGSPELDIQQLPAVVQVITGYYPHDKQVQNAGLMVDTSGRQSITHERLITVAAQLAAGGLTPILSPRHAVSPADLLLKVALCCLHWDLTPAQLWKQTTGDAEALGANGVHAIAAAVFLTDDRPVFAKAVQALASSSLADNGEVLLDRFAAHVEELLSRMRPVPRLQMPREESEDTLHIDQTAGAPATGDAAQQAAADDPADRLGEFQAWLASIDTRRSSCFVILEQCYALAPKLLGRVMASISGTSSEVPTSRIGDLFERIVNHPPSPEQRSQLALFMDVQGDQRITHDEFRLLLPAINYASRNTRLGTTAPLAPQDILMRVALYCSYMNQAPKRVFENVDVSRKGYLNQRSVVLMLRSMLKNEREVNVFAKLLLQHPDLDQDKDGRISLDEFSTAIRRLQRKWEKARVSPARETWRP